MRILLALLVIFWPFIAQPQAAKPTETIGWLADPVYPGPYKVYYSEFLSGPYTNVATVVTNRYQTGPITKGAHFYYVTLVYSNYSTIQQTTNGWKTNFFTYPTPRETEPSERLLLYQPPVQPIYLE